MRGRRVLGRRSVSAAATAAVGRMQWVLLLLLLGRPQGGDVVVAAFRRRRLRCLRCRWNGRRIVARGFQIHPVVVVVVGRRASSSSVVLLFVGSSSPPTLRRTRLLVASVTATIAVVSRRHRSNFLLFHRLPFNSKAITSVRLFQAIYIQTLLKQRTTYLF